MDGWPPIFRIYFKVIGRIPVTGTPVGSRTAVTSYVLPTCGRGVCPTPARTGAPEPQRPHPSGMQQYIISVVNQ